METTSTWNEMFTLLEAAVTLLALPCTALYLCYTSGTLHPLRNRLMRLFISRDDVEHGAIRDSISDRSAVVSFGMVYGIHLDTVTEVESLIKGAQTHEVPLHLIGAAGSAFDREAFAVKPHKSPGKWGDAMSGIALMIFYLATACLLLGAFSSEVLIRIKDTDTLLRVATKGDEGTAHGILRDKDLTFTQQECAALPQPITIEPFVDDEARYNLSVLCAIWTLPAERKELTESLPVQRTAFGAAALVAFMFLLGCWDSLLKRFAIRKLERRTGLARPSVGSTSQRQLVLRVGKIFYLRYSKGHGGFGDCPKAE